jgi:hypothetical protein
LFFCFLLRSKTPDKFFFLEMLGETMGAENEDPPVPLPLRAQKNTEVVEGAGDSVVMDYSMAKPAVGLSSHDSHGADHVSTSDLINDVRKFIPDFDVHRVLTRDLKCLFHFLTDSNDPDSSKRQEDLSKLLTHIISKRLQVSQNSDGGYTINSDTDDLLRCILMNLDCPTCALAYHESKRGISDKKILSVADNVRVLKSLVSISNDLLVNPVEARRNFLVQVNVVLDSFVF